MRTQDTVWKRLAEAMGQPELGEDPRFATHNARGHNQLELDQLIGEWSKNIPSADLEALLNEHAVPNGKIFTAPDMLVDPHFAAREAIVTLAHPLLGDFPMQNVVPKLSDTPGEVRWVGPELGEHTDEVLESVLGMTAEERAELRERGVI
jgi:formyl-CoA transferase